MVLWMWHNTRTSMRGSGWGPMNNKIPESIIAAATRAHMHRVGLQDFDRANTFTAHYQVAGVPDTQVPEKEVTATYTVIDSPRAQGEPFSVHVKYEVKDENDVVWVLRPYFLNRWDDFKPHSTTFHLHPD